jgi:CRP/FNR family transcriptional regulator
LFKKKECVKKENNLETLASCFQHLTEQELAFLDDRKTRVTYRKGETLFKQGAFAPHVLFVCSGLVKIYLETGSGKQVNIQLAVKGSYIAFSTLFDKKTYPYSAQTLTDANLCMIEKEALKKLIFQNSKLAAQLLTRNSNNENRYLTIIENLSYKQMRGKLASALLYLSSEHFKEADPLAQLTRKDIADFATITVESTVKFLKEFEKDGLINLQGKRIDIIDKEQLMMLNQRG